MYCGWPKGWLHNNKNIYKRVVEREYIQESRNAGERVCTRDIQYACVLDFVYLNNRCTVNNF